MIKLLRRIAEPIFFALGFYIVTSVSVLIFILTIEKFSNFLAVIHALGVIGEFYYYAHLVDDLDDKVGMHMIFSGSILETSSLFYRIV